VRKIQELTKLAFGELSQHDPLKDEANETLFGAGTDFVSLDGSRTSCARTLTTRHRAVTMVPAPRCTRWEAMSLSPLARLLPTDRVTVGERYGHPAP
jgi:hypothetical protein